MFGIPDIPILLDLIVGGLFLGSFYVLLASGMSLLWGMSKTVNIAHGDFMILGSYFTYFFVVSIGVSPFLCLIVVPIVLGGVGYALYRIGLAKNISRAEPRTEIEYTSIFMTFGLIFVVSNSLAAIYTANFRTYPFSLGSFSFAGTTIGISKILSILVSFSAVGTLWLILKKSWFGLGVRAIYDDEISASLMGVNPEKVHIFIFIVALAFAGLAGTLFSMSRIMTPFQGLFFTMIGFVVLIIGGIGSIKGALILGATVGLIESFITYYIPPLLKIAVVYSILIAVLVFKPRGLFRGI